MFCFRLLFSGWILFCFCFPATIVPAARPLPCRFIYIMTNLRKFRVLCNTFQAGYTYPLCTPLQSMPNVPLVGPLDQVWADFRTQRPTLWTVRPLWAGFLCPTSHPMDRWTTLGRFPCLTSHSLDRWAGGGQRGCTDLPQNLPKPYLKRRYVHQISNRIQFRHTYRVSAANQRKIIHHRMDRFQLF